MNNGLISGPDYVSVGATSATGEAGTHLMAPDAALWDKCMAHAESSRLPDHEGEYLFTVQQEARLLYLIATAPSLTEQVRRWSAPPNPAMRVGTSRRRH